MARRRKQQSGRDPSVKISWRVPATLALLVERSAQETGWSESKTAVFLCELGVACLLERDQAKVAAEAACRRAQFEAQVKCRTVEVEAGQAVKKARAAVRHAAGDRRKVVVGDDPF